MGPIHVDIYPALNLPVVASCTNASSLSFNLEFNFGLCLDNEDSKPLLVLSSSDVWKDGLFASPPSCKKIHSMQNPSFEFDGS